MVIIQIQMYIYCPQIFLLFIPFSICALPASLNTGRLYSQEQYREVQLRDGDVNIWIICNLGTACV